jgi:hypothetical protein
MCSFCLLVLFSWFLRVHIMHLQVLFFMIFVIITIFFSVLFFMVSKSYPPSSLVLCCLHMWNRCSLGLFRFLIFWSCSWWSVKLAFYIVMLILVLLPFYESFPSESFDVFHVPLKKKSLWSFHLVYCDL